MQWQNLHFLVFFHSEADQLIGYCMQFFYALTLFFFVCYFGNGAARERKRIIDTLLVPAIVTKTLEAALGSTSRAWLATDSQEISISNPV